MAGSQGNRKKQLSQNTATAIHHTCNRIISLCWHLLATSNKYVLLGQFSTDPLEKEFGNFINIQQCIEKLHIKQTSLLLNQNVNIDEFHVNPGHQCTSCDYKLSAEGSEIFDNLENFFQTWQHKQIRKRTSSESFEPFLEGFSFICLYFWDDWLLYTHTLADVFQPSRVLFVKPSNYNADLNQTLYSFAGNRLNKGFSGTCK